jgi:[ribosomal protein S18]-alanine N-acetyltransferase
MRNPRPGTILDEGGIVPTAPGRIGEGAMGGPTFRIRPLDDDDVETILTWRYDAPYDVYDPGAEADDVSEMRAATGGRAPWFAVEDESGEVVGFFEFTPVGSPVEEVEIGLGLRPDRTGRGLGPGFVEAAVAFARDTWGPSRVVLDVFPWNERAIRAYEQAGFARDRVHVRRFPSGVEREFLRMSRPA